MKTLPQEVLVPTIPTLVQICETALIRSDFIHDTTDTTQQSSGMADSLLTASRSFHHKSDALGTVTESCKVYHRRWYILVVFSLIAGVQAAVWNTWGPITGSAEDVFGWSDGTIALLENWGPIAYIVSFLLFSWLMDVKGW